MMSDISAATSIDQSVQSQGGTLSNRSLQGLTGVASALSGYGSIGGVDTYNFGAFMTPFAPPCAEGTLQASGVGGATACFLRFDDAPSGGVDAFVGAMNASPAIGAAIQQGQITVLAQALASDPAFAKQVAFFYGSNINLFASFLAIGLKNAAAGLGQTPEWFEGQARVDTLLAGSGDVPSGGGGGGDVPSGGSGDVPSGGGTAASPEPEYTTGQKVVYWGAVAALVYGVYKIATRRG